MSKTFLSLFVFIFLSTSTGCNQFTRKSEPAQDVFAVSPDEISFSVMTYNVENLFDTLDDPKKDDLTFLPLSAKKNPKHIAECNKIEVEKWKDQCLNFDWSEKALSSKLHQLSLVIRSSGVDGRGADLLMLQEVENESVLKRLRDEYLSDLGYKTLLLIEGNDKRGIDVAFLSRFDVIGAPKLHQIPFKKTDQKRVQDTRGILEANFRLPDNSTLTAYAVHFPAPFHPSHMRRDAFEHLNKISSKLPKERLFVAGGDFNLTAEEDQSEKVLETHMLKKWEVAHRNGCKKCLGTNYFAPKKSWSFLDMIFYSKSFERSPWQMGDVRIINSIPSQKNKAGEPDGISDHWPLQVIFIQKVSTI